MSGNSINVNFIYEIQKELFTQYKEEINENI